MDSNLWAIFLTLWSTSMGILGGILGNFFVYNYMNHREQVKPMEKGIIILLFILLILQVVCLVLLLKSI
jgi:hypothetical protein